MSTVVLRGDYDEGLSGHETARVSEIGSRLWRHAGGGTGAQSRRRADAGNRLIHPKTKIATVTANMLSFYHLTDCHGFPAMSQDTA